MNMLRDGAMGDRDSERMGLSDIGLMDGRLECGMENCEIQGTLRFYSRRGQRIAKEGGIPVFFQVGHVFSQILKYSDTVCFRLIFTDLIYLLFEVKTHF